MTNNTFTVNGMFGNLSVKVSTGCVLVYHPMHEPQYADIRRFNVQEWRGFYNADPANEWIDILDIGFWDTNGIYSPPVEFHRNLFETRPSGRNLFEFTIHNMGIIG